MKLASSITPTVIGTVRRRIAALIDKETRSAMWAKIVKGYKVTTVIEDHDVTVRPFQFEIVVVGGQFASVRDQMPVLAGKSIL